MSRPRVVVVGGGVIGVTSAYYLARAGADVILLERRELAAGASYGNAGTISAGHPPLNKPGRVREALARMLDSTNPLYIPPRWDPGLWRWLAEFAAHCTAAHVAHCMDVMAPIGLESLSLFDELVERERLSCHYRREGYYAVCATPEGLEEVRHEVGLMGHPEYHPEILSEDELRSREPALKPGLAGGAYFPEGATCNPAAFVRELAGRATDRGVEIRTGVEVLDVLARAGRVVGVRIAGGGEVPGDAVLLATGPFSTAVARRAGIRLPVQPGKGYHRDLDPAAGATPPLAIACVLYETSVFCTPMDGFVRYAGTMEFSGINEVMRRARLEQLTRSAGRYLTGIGGGAPLSEWCGLRPVSADGLPIVGPVPGVKGLIVATGHGMLGLTLAPVTGKLVTSHILGGEMPPEAAALEPTRFH